MTSWKKESSGQYLNASLLEGKPDQTVTISEATVETVGQDDERKIVLAFHNRDKRMIVNRTNGDTLALAFGDEIEGWVGKEITLFTIPNVYQGKPGLRIRPPATPDEQFTDEALTDDLPF